MAKEFRGKASILEIFRKYHVDLNFHTEYLMLVLSHWESLANWRTFISGSVLYMYVAWIIKILAGGGSQEAELMIEALSLCVKGAQGSERDLSVFAMYYCLLMYFPKPSEVTNKVVDWFTTFFSLKVMYPKECFVLLSQVIGELWKNDCAREIGTQFCCFVCILCEEKKQCFSGEIAQMIIQPLMMPLSKLEIPVLSLYNHISRFLTEEDNMEVFSILGASMIKLITGEASFLHFPEVVRTDAIELPPLMTCEAVLRTWPKCVFVNGLDLKIVAAFPDRMKIDDLMYKSVVNRLSIIVSTAVRTPGGTHIFLDSLAAELQRRDNYIWDILVAYLYICYHVPPQFVRKQDMELLMDEPLFNPCITVFDSYEDFAKIRSLRYLVISIAFKTGSEGQLLLRWVRYPYLFSEILHNIGRHLELVVFEDKRILNLCRSLMTCTLYYQRLNYQYDDNTVHPIEFARTSILLLISRLIGDHNHMGLFFANNYFMSFFLSFLFEMRLRGFVCGYILTYLLKLQGGLPIELLSMLERIFLIITASFPDEEHLLIAIDLLGCINDALIHNPVIKTSFEPICQCLFLSFEKMTIDDPVMQNCVIQCIQFFSITATSKTLGTAEIGALNLCIRRTFAGQLPDQLKMKLIHLIAGDYHHSITPSFPIRHPRVMKMFLQLCLNDANVIENIEFITQVVQFSRDNAIQCHRSELDLLLLGLIKEQQNKDVVSVLLTLFQTIAVQTSSVTVVQRYISLFSPINGTHIPKFQEMYLKTMNNVMTMTSKYPTSYIPISQAGGFADIIGMTAADISNGFTFLFWIYLESSVSQYKPAACDITDAKGNKLGVFFSGGTMFVKERSGIYESNGKVEHIIPRDQWVFIAVTFSRIEDGTVIAAPYISSNPVKPLEFIPLAMAPGPVSFQVAGLTKDSIQSEKCARLGPFGCYRKLTREEIAAVMDQGPRIQSCMPLKPLFFYVVEQDSETIDLKPLCENEQIEVRTTKTEMLSDNNFTEALTNMCKVEVMLPLLAQLDMTTVDGEECPNLLKGTLEFFTQVFCLSEQAQESFYRENGFGIISHLIRQASDKHITYQLYQQLYHLMGSLRHGDLQASILRDVLLEPEIWLHSDADNHIRILRHWDRTLCPTMINLLLGRFQNLLYIMRSYYYYNVTDEDRDLICDITRTRGQPLNIAECRQSLMHMAMMIANERFTVDDFTCLTSHCLTCTDIDQVVDMLCLLKFIAKSSPCPLQKIVSEIDIVSPLYTLLARNNAKVAVLICEIIADIYHSGVKVDHPITEHVMYLLEQMSPSMITTQMFLDMTNLVVNGNPELLPVWCWIAVTERIEDSDILTVLDQFVPCGDFVTDMTWALWPIVLCYKRDNFNIRARLLSFVADCNANRWAEGYAIIDIIGVVLGHDAYEMKTLFLRCIGQIMEQDDVGEVNAMKFFSLVRHLLFMRLENERNDYLHRLIASSPFKTKMLPRSPSFGQLRMKESKRLKLSNHGHNCTSTGSLVIPQKVNSLTSICHPELEDSPCLPKSVSIPQLNNILEFKEPLSKFKFRGHNYHFGIRLDNDGRWLDQDLAEMTLILLEKYVYQAGLKLSLLISSMLLYYNHTFVISHLVGVRPFFDEATIQCCAPLIALCNHHATMSRIDSCIITAALPEITDLNVNCLAGDEIIADNDIISEFKQTEKMIRDFVSTATQHIVSSFGFFRDDFVAVVDEQILTETSSIKARFRLGKRDWSQLWRQLAIDPAPWSVNLGSKERFKRDFISCLHTCPFKMKRNWKFNDHKKASFAREDSVFDDSKTPFVLKRHYSLSSSQMIDLPDYDGKPQRLRSRGTSGKPQLILPCLVINPVSSRDATFLLHNNAIELVFENGKTKKILFAEILHIFFRQVLHRPNAMEIFEDNGKSIFIEFLRDDIFAILSRIKQMSLPRVHTIQTVGLVPFFRQNTLTPLWIRNRISNFEYLMHLNMMSGRTFNDLSQYPVFPWVLSDYTSDVLDLENPSSYRDLKKPVSALNPDKLKKLENRVSEMGTAGEPLCTTGYSCAFNVCGFLVRMEPFASIHIDIQGGRFDHSARLFNSVADTFANVMNNPTDFRELIPEFYFCPEFLVNSNNFDLGSCETFGKVDDVVLPPWAEGSPSKFIYMMRKALESNFVSSMLHHWIDLIWGIKQRGKYAAHAKNTYRKEMYSDIWDDPNMTEDRQFEAEACLMHVGQIPVQLFTSSHPSKHVNTDSGSPFAHPFIIPAHKITDVSFAGIENLSGWKYRVTIVDTKGTIVSHVADFSHRKSLNGGFRRQSKGSVYNPDGLSMTGSVSDTTMLNSESDELHGIGLSSSDRELKGYSDLKIDIFARSNSVASINSTRIAVVSHRTNKLYIVDTSRCTIESTMSDVVGIYTSGEYAAIAHTNAVIGIYKYDLSAPIFSIPSYGDSISCCCVSCSFMSVVIGTRDGSLILSSLTKGSIIRVVNLDGARPHHVTVTPGWGFIVVYAQRVILGKPEHLLYVFNVNGELLRTTTIDSPVTCWSAWTSVKGFDYIVYADDNGKLFMFEVFFCKPGDGLYRCRSPVTALSYLKDSCCIVAIAKDGRVIFIPQSVPSL